MSAPKLPWDWYSGGPVPNPTPPVRPPDMDVGPAPPVGPVEDKLGTRLMPDEEQRYQQWKAGLPKNLQYEGDYDLRGFFKKNPTFRPDVPGAHMTDEFKLPNHPTFSNESMYYNDKTAKMGGHWEGDVYIPNDTHFKQRVDETKEAAVLASRRKRRRPMP